MEIKIIDQLENEQKDWGQETYLFEGDNIIHRHVYYESGEDFFKKYNDCVKNIDNGCVIGVPEYFWQGNNKKEKNENISAGYFVVIYYKKYGELCFIVIKNSHVYITNKGQAVDKILVG